MTTTVISKEKLLADLKQMMTDTKDIDNFNRLLYAMGRNSVVSNLLVGIMAGDYDD